jgi:fructoselysine/glucoselysine PTS system EIIA component
LRKLYLVSHGNLATGMKNSIEMIIGEKENLKAFNLMPGESPEDITAKIKSEFNDKDEFVIISDIQSGSIHNASLQLCTLDNVYLVSGMISMLVLEILLLSEDEKFSDHIDSILNGTKDSLRLYHNIANDENENNDF